MPILVSTSGVSTILSFGSGLFNSIKPLFFVLIAVFVGLGLFEFILSLFSQRQTTEKHVVITENRTINSALDKTSLKYQEYTSLAKVLGVKLSRSERRELKRLEKEEKKGILEKRFEELKSAIFGENKK